MIKNFRSRSKRAMIALFALALVGTGMLSTAALTDQLVITQQYNVASINLQASPNGTTFSEGASLTWPAIKTGLAYEAYNKLQIKNSGTAALDFTIATDRTGAIGTAWGGVKYDMAKIANAADACDGTTVFNATSRLTGKTTDWTISQNSAVPAEKEHMNAGAVLFVCVKTYATTTVTATVVDGDTATFPVTLTGAAS